MNKRILIFDMDGTLYSYKHSKGVNQFYNSYYHLEVKSNIHKFILAREKRKISRRKILKIIKHAESKEYQVYFEYYVSKYGVKKEDFFHEAFGQIDVNKYVKREESIINFLYNLKSKDFKLILLTYSPLVWAEKVLDRLNIKDVFYEIYTANDFNNKEEIFKKIALEHKDFEKYSVGDEVGKDIIPAEHYGFKGVYVKSPNQIELLIKTLINDI